jgi:hypothetical protein
MEPGDPPNDAPLPPFLDAAPGVPAVPAASATSQALGTGSATAEVPANGPPDAGAEPGPRRVVPLLIPLPPRGEAALAGLPIAGITKKRLAWIAAAAVAVWVLLLFARQVGDASAAQARADEIRRENAALAARVEALAAERELVQQPSYVALEARGYGLGSTRERPFVLAAGAPSLPPDAPGSATLRVGRAEASVTPLESWLEILFGPTDD